MLFFAPAPRNTLSGLLLLTVEGDETDQGDEVRRGVLLIQLLLHVSSDVRGQDFQQGLNIRIFKKRKERPSAVLDSFTVFKTVILLM
jgi:hypothetical protein